MAMTHEKWRNHKYYKIDPFDEIQPALLNNVDIEKYVVDAECLVERDDFDESRLKAASYEMRFLGKLYDWNRTTDGRLQRRCRNVCCDDKITLCRNSITYLWMKEKLLLPEYIAVRFNLHIRHVHKGILLGTGPLVDPGFFGNLLIPLHNLTDNDYELKGGEGFIWVEFTKVSKHVPGNLKSFPSKKDITDPEQYMKKSTILERGVQSAFKGALDDAKKNARDARNEANRFKRTGYIAIVIGAFAIIVSILGIWLTGHNLISHATKLAQDSQNQAFSTKIEKQDAKLEKFEEDMEKMKIHLMEISQSLNELKQQNDRSNDIVTR